MSAGKKRKEPHVPTAATRHTVSVMAANGATRKATAKRLGIALNTLSKHYKRELNEGFDDAYTFVVGKLWKKIQEENLAAIFFWLKTRARWTERHEVSGPNGNAIPLAYENIPDDDLAKVIATLRASLDTGKGGAGGSEAEG